MSEREKVAKLEPWMVEWLKIEAETRRAKYGSHGAAAIEAALATPEQEAVEVLGRIVSHFEEWGIDEDAFDGCREARAILASQEANDAE